ncbi:uncharacterized protein L3040_005880 [Drepanopeziza brunnea f. sp. 'multigermtubi']|uniref:Alpha-l-fucosidase n=1 Tax=Marssonina brunnea f. sp. multigermtubi (strain MB_m1) TaxID=1072389 RepID=K1W516_MARBU|nr:alpha-l-fucosidase [Drepanopeziza brunnea f. sp. 'multigermtubi' MB_m1]EKD12015.1 alpha-l-fucosidase [Drepanopeziza brunnea f. sp. 'multigermtubi' MB_m1]KAJ5040218.1 hypothetical protein L3040_005880 [Drepanopeziza brunnea f. sp. 'multigermtubi']
MVAAFLYSPRAIVASSLIFFPLTSGAQLSPPNSASVPLRLWDSAPAGGFSDSYLIGNGRIGAALSGSAQKEYLGLNEDSLWSGGPIDRVNPDASAYMGNIQSSVSKGRFQEGQTTASFAYVGNPVSARHYDYLGELQLVMNHGTKVTGYERWLDLQDSTAGLQYSVDGVTFQREYLASNPAGVMAIKISADKAGAVDFNILLRRGGTLNRWVDYSVKVGNDTIVMGGGSGGVKPVVFAAGASVVASGGRVYTIGDYVKVEGADEAWIYFSAWTDFRKEDPRAAVESDLKSVKSQSYKSIREAHVEDYQSLASRVSIDLGTSSAKQKKDATSARVAGLGAAFDPEIVALAFQFGRYMLISSARQGTLAPTLQGIWNKDPNPQWGSRYTININTQMNHWLALVTNLAELNEPLFSLIENVRQTGLQTAQKMYGAAGAVCHHNTDIWGDSAPVDNWALSTWWPTGLVWLVTHIHDTYLFTGNATLLEKKYDTLVDAAAFFLDFITPYKGWMVTNPSVSPENVYRIPNGGGGTAAMTAGPTMDNSLLRALFSIVLEAQSVLGKKDTALADRLEAARASLPPLMVSKRYGGIQEWIEDFEETAPGHRHLSHLWGLYPGHEITSANATFFEAARKSLNRRLSFDTDPAGWSQAWAIAISARLFNATGVARMLDVLLTTSTHAKSLLGDLSPAPFQIDSTFGLTAGIAEALLQSHELVSPSSSKAPDAASMKATTVGNPSGVPLVRLLPALPKTWAQTGGGSITGLLGRGGFVVDISWDEKGQLVNATIVSRNGGPVWLTLGTAAIGKGTTEGTPTIQVNEKKGSFVYLETEVGGSHTVKMA